MSKALARSLQFATKIVYKAESALNVCLNLRDRLCQHMPYCTDLFCNAYRITELLPYLYLLYACQLSTLNCKYWFVRCSSQQKLTKFHVILVRKTRFPELGTVIVRSNMLGDFWQINMQGITLYAEMPASSSGITSYSLALNLFAAQKANIRCI